jgi:hypothetical protein
VQVYLPSRPSPSSSTTNDRTPPVCCLIVSSRPSRCQATAQKRSRDRATAAQRRESTSGGGRGSGAARRDGERRSDGRCGVEGREQGRTRLLLRSDQASRVRFGRARPAWSIPLSTWTKPVGKTAISGWRGLSTWYCIVLRGLITPIRT